MINIALKNESYIYRFQIKKVIVYSLVTDFYILLTMTFMDHKLHEKLAGAQ